jgi:4-diphosphocytidyl-2-C-methyl-D-erythritol kinase
MKALYDVAAPAKLNLFLHVVGRRADGYHLLQSPFVLIDWCDTLHFERRDDGLLRRHDIADALPDDDLCLRAARLLQAESGTRHGVDIGVLKRIPAQAGMGGGSSDAATTLLALNRLWQLRWPRSRLLALGAQLGADVPFFVGGRNAFVEGIGDVLTPIDWPRHWYAVVKPAASLSTAQIFTSPHLCRNTDAVILSGFLADAAKPEPSAVSAGQIGSRSGVTSGNSFGRNDLQPVAEVQCPDVARAAEWLRSRYGHSRMTGSGSAVFAGAGAGDQPLATWPEDALPTGWVGRMCRSLEQHPLVGWAD